MNITAPIFHDEAAALAHIEASRWDGSPNCPHCGSLNVHRMAGKTQAGMWLCNDCRDKFTVRTGTVMERSHIPLHKWLLAMHLMSASKKGISAHQLHRMLGITYKSAWFLCHRIREAMNVDVGPLGGQNKVVEVDETYIGGKAKNRATRKPRDKQAVVALVERDGNVKSKRVATFHSISEAHLHRYLAEFDFRYNHRKVSDVERAEALLKGVQGKRLYYHQPHQA